MVQLTGNLNRFWKTGRTGEAPRVPCLTKTTHFPCTEFTVSSGWSLPWSNPWTSESSEAEEGRDSTSLALQLSWGHWGHPFQPIISFSEGKSRMINVGKKKKWVWVALAQGSWGGVRLGPRTAMHSPLQSYPPPPVLKPQTPRHQHSSTTSCPFRGAVSDTKQDTYRAAGWLLAPSLITVHTSFRFLPPGLFTLEHQKCHWNQPSIITDSSRVPRTCYAPAGTLQHPGTVIPSTKKEGERLSR